MANTQIANLPLYTGSISGSYLVMNNSSETTTYKVTRETFLGGGNVATIASGIVNAGTYVELGTLRARLPQTGNRSIQVASTTGNVYVVIGSSVHSQNGVAGSTISNAAPVTITTTPTYLNPNYNFLTAGATDTWVIMDEAQKLAWRITYVIGPSYNNNLITIERLL